MTHAPLVVKDKVIVGVAGGEYGIRGFIAAYDAKTGKEAWRFYTIPGPGEPGHETWAGDSWQHGGASVWVTGSYDPELNLTYWGIGNPGPDWNPRQREGDNLYCDSRGRPRRRHRQAEMAFPVHAARRSSITTPCRSRSWPTCEWKGAMRKLMLWANRNGFFYVLDRATGKFLLGKPFVKVTWANGLDESGRPSQRGEQQPSREGTLVYPGVQGGTNWYSPSYSPRTGLFYISGWVDYVSASYSKWAVSMSQAGATPAGRRARSFLRFAAAPVNTWGPRAPATAPCARSTPRTGELKWEFKMTDVTDSGILTTASDLLFTGGREGYFYALDARDGKLLWKATVGGQVAAGPITYSVDGKQYVGVAAGHSFFVFALRSGS